MNPATSAASLPQAVPAPARSPEELAALLAEFRENGFLVFRDVVPRDRLADLHQRIVGKYEADRAAGRLFVGGGVGTGHLNCFPGAGSRFFLEALEAHGVLDVLRAISPGSVRLPNVGCNLNLPGSVVQHYHADSDYTAEFMVANVATVDTDERNGAIQIVPGTHRRFYKYWRFALEAPWRRAIRVPTRAGDVILRSSNTWHRGMPNLTAAPRPMLALTWEQGGSALPDPYAVEGGEITFRPNWFRTDWRGRLRERTFLAVPLSYAAYRFARSLVGNKGY